MKNKWLKKLYLTFFIPVAANLPLIVYSLHNGIWLHGSLLQNTAVLALCLTAILILWLQLNICPFNDGQHMGIRLRIMMGGRTLCLCALYGLIAHSAVCFILYPRLDRSQISTTILAVNALYGFGICLILLWNGILRIFFTSLRLRIRTRVLMLLCMWIPFANLAVLLYALHMTYAEYDFACYKDSVRTTRTGAAVL